MISKRYKSLEYVDKIEWSEVFDDWRKNESSQESWRRHWEKRGFDTWGEWRTDFVKSIVPEEKRWTVYKIQNPRVDVQNFYGVPSRGWINKCYGGVITKRLADIVDHPIIQGNEKIKEVIQKFPKKTMLIGVVYDDKIVIIEGMHRALALIQMDDNSDVQIALAEHEGFLEQVGKKLVN